MVLPAHKLIQYYRGNAQKVVVTSKEGLRLQLPIDVFKPYITQNGIYGVFTVWVDENNKMIRLEKKT